LIQHAEEIIGIITVNSP